MRTLIFAGLLAATGLGGCTGYADADSHINRYAPFDFDRPDPAYGGYDAARYYRGDRRYRERRLNRDDRLYRGQDGRFYCRRGDGTTGLIVGDVPYNTLAPGGSALLGALAGGAAGREAVRNGSARCR